MKTLSDVPDIFNQAQYLADRHLLEGRGGRTVIYYEDRQITYAELVAMTNRTGNSFKNLGVEMENRVLLILPDCPEFFYCYLGAMKIGAIPIPVNTLASSHDFEYFLNDSRAKVLVVSPSLLPKIEAIKSELKHLKQIIVVGVASVGAVSYDELVAHASETLEAAETSKDDMAFWMYTSGTTGQPKAVVHLHHDLLFYEPPVCNVLSATEHDIAFVTSKMFFSYGRNHSLELPLITGGAVVLTPEWPNVREVLAS
jgi:acyl-coenzyme A synthetase/AMP-(fatty) acid ligase